jgi:hypothetical protein
MVSRVERRRRQGGVLCSVLLVTKLIHRAMLPRWSISVDPTRRSRPGAQRLLSDLATSRQTLITLPPGEVTSPGPSTVSESYQQILAAFTPDGPGLRANHVCRALGIGIEPKDPEGIRATLTRLVNRQILTETEPGLVTLARKRT